jgi:hypothetical protein
MFIYPRGDPDLSHESVISQVVKKAGDDPVVCNDKRNLLQRYFADAVRLRRSRMYVVMLSGSTFNS